MKRSNYLFGIFGLIVLTTAGLFLKKTYDTPVYQPNNYGNLKNATGLADFAAQYYHMLRENPLTGKIDMKDVLAARQEVAMFMKNKNSANSIHWEYTGPNFVGGRARGLIQDNQSGQSSIFYAGSVGGGVFITYNGGEQWYDYNSNITSLAISCLTQTSNGVLFVGTGCSHEGGQANNATSGIAGDGLFRRETDGNGNHTFTRLIGPSTQNSGYSDDWSTINQIAASPTDVNKLYVGMDEGFRYATNPHGSPAEITWVNPIKVGGGSLDFTGEIDDIAVSKNGEDIYVTSTAKFFKLKDQGGSSISTEIDTTFPNLGNGRIAIALAPSDNNVVYLAIAAGSGCLYGIYQSRNGGKTFKLIGPPGGSFDPYANPGTNCQGNYDNAIAVFPDDPGKIIVGGTQLWKWEENPNNLGTGGWSQIAVTNDFGLTDTNYVHADKHRIIIPTPTTVLIASDGGIGKSLDGGKTWGQSNNGFNVTQFYSIASAMGVQVVFNGIPYLSEQIMGGTQDNGTQVVGININRPQDGFEIRGGDGFDCAFSELGNYGFATVYYGDLARGSQTSGISTFYDAELAARCPGPSNGTPTCGDFYTRLAYWERPYVNTTFDSVKVFATDTAKQGDTIEYISAIGTTPMFAPTPKDLFPQDSVIMPDFAQSKLAFFTGSEGIYMTRDAPKSTIQKYNWDRICGPESYPDALAGSPFCMRFTSDGNHLFVGTTTGSIYRIDNLNAGYDSLTLDIRSNQCVLTCTKIAEFAGRFVTSLSIDPNEPKNVVVTLGSYGQTNYVAKTTTATTATSQSGLGGFTYIQGNLPKMPVYSSIISEHSNNTVLIGTEFGVYGSDDAFSSPTPTWYAGVGMPAVAVYGLTQQTQPYIFPHTNPKVPNAHYRKVYAGTHGRGFYKTGGLVGIEEPHSTMVQKPAQIQFKIYPNPMNEVGNITIDSPDQKNVVVEVFDLNGKLVTTLYSGVVNSGKQKIEFNVSELRTGTYIARLRSENEVQVSKFVVMK